MIETVIDMRPQVAAPVQMGFDYSQIDEGIRDEVKQAARSIHQLGKAMQTSLIAIGKRLIEVKGMLPEGQFSAWIEAEFQLSQRSAQNFMNVARVYGDRGHEIISPLSDTVLYMLAAPSTPEAARVEVEQAAIEGKKVTVEFAKATVQKHRPEPVQYAPVYALESKVSEWLRDVIGEAGTPNAETVLANVKLQLDEPHSPGNWLDMLATYVGNALAYRKKDLHQAINNVREQRRVAARQAQARKVYVEPVAKVEPEPAPKAGMNLGYLPDSERIEIEDAELRQAGFHLVATKAPPQDINHYWFYRFWWARFDGSVDCGPERDTAALAIEDARRTFAEFHAPSKPASDGILTREWIAHVLERYNPANADFDTALQAATLPELQDAMATLWPDEPHHRERCAALKARMEEFAPAPQHAPQPAPLDPIVADLISLPSHRNELVSLMLSATVEQLQAALAGLPTDDNQGRRTVLEYRLKKLRKEIGLEAPPSAPKPTPDPRLEDARALIDLLVAARDTARAHYGELTGQHTDMLEFERGVAAMLPPLERLIAVLEGTE